MNSYILALSIIVMGIFIHYTLFSGKEGLENNDKDQTAAKEKAIEEKWEGTVAWYTTQFNNFLDLANKQEAIVSGLEADEKAYKQILSCLQYREKLMNAAVEQRRGARQSQKSESKNKLKASMSSVKL